MAAKTDSERITELEAQVQQLAEDVFQHIGHLGTVEWDPEDGWMLVEQPPRKVTARHA